MIAMEMTVYVLYIAFWVNLVNLEFGLAGFMGDLTMTSEGHMV